MKVSTKYYEGDQQYFEGESFDISIAYEDGKTDELAISGGEPEDNTLSRDLNFAFEIPAMLRDAYEAGKRGESFELTEETVKASKWA